jgi:Flp pilus assembly protein TadD
MLVTSRRWALYLCTACLCLAQTDYDQGVAFFQKGEFAQAIPYLTRATGTRPQDAQVWKALGVAYAAQSRYTDAEAPLRRACELNPKLEDACYYHARSLYALDRFDESLKVLEPAPKTWKVRLAAAQALEALGRAGEAENEFRASLSLVQNNDARPGIALGLFLLRQGRHQEAIAPLEIVAARFPSSAEAHLYLGRALLERGNTSGALPHLERAVALDPASAQAHLLLAKAYVRAGRTAEAQSHFAEASRRAQ